MDLKEIKEVLEEGTGREKYYNLCSQKISKHPVAEECESLS